LSAVEGRSQLLSKAKPYLEKIPAGFFREMMFEKLQTKSGINLQNFAGNATKLHSKRSSNVKPLERTTGSNLMRTVLSLLLQYPHLAGQVELQGLNFAEMDFAGMDLLEDVLQVIKTIKPENSAVLLESYRDSPHEKVVNALFGRALNIVDGSEENVFCDALNQLAKQSMENRMKALIDKVSRGEPLSVEEIMEFKTGGKL